MSEPSAQMLTLKTTDVVFYISSFRLLMRIKKDVEKQSRLSPLVRFLRRASIAEMLDDHIDALDSAWRTFDVRASASCHALGIRCILWLTRHLQTACLIALRKKVERQAIYDDRSQVRSFLENLTRPSSVVCT